MGAAFCRRCRGTAVAELRQTPLSCGRPLLRSQAGVINADLFARTPSNATSHTHTLSCKPAVCFSPTLLQSQAGAISADLFARTPSNVPLLLSLLEDEPVGLSDFYVRYYTVQLLTLLAQVWTAGGVGDGSCSRCL